jgi:hypothetical protein
MVGWTVSISNHFGIQIANKMSRGSINGIALKHYIDLFDFSKLRLDQAFRSDISSLNSFASDTSM